MQSFFDGRRQASGNNPPKEQAHSGNGSRPPATAGADGWIPWNAANGAGGSRRRKNPEPDIEVLSSDGTEAPPPKVEVHSENGEARRIVVTLEDGRRLVLRLDYGGK